MSRAVLVLVLVLAAAPPAVAEPSPEEARAAFARFTALDGVWRGQSTRGWTDETTFRTIAGGSAVLATSFDAHPGETMATLFTVNGDALELVHYCVAKNAPRLRATRIEDGGRQVVFTFVDGANLPTRDRGHMDQAVYRFLDDGTVRTRWSWYECRFEPRRGETRPSSEAQPSELERRAEVRRGKTTCKERWMEEIALVRKP